jgi:hypothetical protein
MENPIENIDWFLLARQKETLQNLYDMFKNDERITDDLDGILNTIDAIQDYAVDELGVEESEVFNLEED